MAGAGDTGLGPVDTEGVNGGGGTGRSAGGSIVCEIPGSSAGTSETTGLGVAAGEAGSGDAGGLGGSASGVEDEGVGSMMQMLN